MITKLKKYTENLLIFKHEANSFPDAEHARWIFESLQVGVAKLL